MATRRTTLGDKPSNRRITFDINSTPVAEGFISSLAVTGSSTSSVGGSSTSSEAASFSKPPEASSVSKPPEVVGAGLVPARTSSDSLDTSTSLVCLSSDKSASPDISSREKSISWLGSSFRVFRLRAIPFIKNDMVGIYFVLRSTFCKGSEARKVINRQTRDNPSSWRSPSREHGLSPSRLRER